MAGIDRARHVVEPAPAESSDVGRHLWTLMDARRRTEGVLAGIGSQAVAWREPGRNAISDILYHVAAIEADWLYTEVLEREFPEEIVALFPLDVRDASGELARVDERLDELWRRIAIVRRALHDALATMSADDFRRPRALAQYDVTPEWVVHHLLQHEAEHRAEISAVRIVAERSVSSRS